MTDIPGLVSTVYNPVPVEDVKSVEEVAVQETVDVGAESSSSLSDSVPSRGS